MNRYSAQKQYWKAKQTKQDKEKIADVVLLQKLQVCARVCRAVRRMGLGHMVRRRKGLAHGTGCMTGPPLLRASGGFMHEMSVLKTLMGKSGVKGHELGQAGHGVPV